MAPSAAGFLNGIHRDRVAAIFFRRWPSRKRSAAAAEPRFQSKIGFDEFDVVGSVERIGSTAVAGPSASIGVGRMEALSS
jgi:hypothetical protein